MRRPIGPVLTALLCLSLVGCKVTEDDINYWTGTVKGPGKIVAVLMADKYDDELRVYAGLALVRMEPREDVDGVSELQAAARQLPEETRTRIVDQMASGLIEMMRGADTPQAGGTEDAAPPRQIRAKDAAFLLIPYASAEHRQELTQAVVDWFVVDFNGRNLAGNYSAEQVVRQLGAPAAARLVNALNARLPQQALVKLAELINTLGNDDAKTRAAARLVEIEREMEASEFMDWLEERLRAQLQEGGREVNEERVALAAGLNRENFITLGALPAMKHLNHVDVIQNRLLEMAQQTTAEGVAPEALEARRTKALQALEGGTREDQVSALLDLALGGDSVPLGVRDYAFDRIGDTRSTAALPRLWTVFAETTDWRVRWRVGSLILTVGGADVVQEFFNRLDDDAYAREELYGYGERISQMRPPPTDFINGQLRSPSWFDRIIALYFWEKKATADDIPRISALATDSAATNGEHWEDQDTVGKVAEAVAGAVRERLEREARAQNGGDAAGGAPEAGDTPAAEEGSE